MLLIFTVVYTARSVSVERYAFDWNIHPAAARQSLYLNKYIWVSSSWSIFPALSILIWELCCYLEFALISFLLLFWGVHPWGFCLLCFKVGSGGEHEQDLMDFGVPGIIPHYLWEIWVGKALCGVSSTNTRGKEIYSSSTYRWCLILQKECDVSSARWFNALVDFIARVGMLF